MTEYVIDRSKWRCGGKTNDDHGDTCLLNDQGRMCCLGQVLKQDGVADGLLLHRGMPANAFGLKAKQEHWTLADTQDGAHKNARIAEVMAETNDRPKISQTERERELKKLAEQVGHTLVFKGRLRP